MNAKKAKRARQMARKVTAPLGGIYAWGRNGTRLEVHPQTARGIYHQIKDALKEAPK